MMADGWDNDCTVVQMFCAISLPVLCSISALTAGHPACKNLPQQSWKVLLWESGLTWSKSGKLSWLH